MRRKNTTQNFDKILDQRKLLDFSYLKFFSYPSVEDHSLSFLFGDGKGVYCTPEGVTKNLKLENRRFKFKGDLDPSLSFEHILHESSLNVELDTISILHKAFSYLDEKKHSTLVFLGPTKSGYNVYYNGVIGFLPLSQLRLLIPAFLSSYEKNKITIQKLNSFTDFFSEKTLINFFIFIVSSSIKKFGYFRVLLPIKSSISLQPCCAGNPFSKLSTKQVFPNRLNLIFSHKSSKSLRREV